MSGNELRKPARMNKEKNKNHSWQSSLPASIFSHLYLPIKAAAAKPISGSTSLLTVAWKIRRDSPNRNLRFKLIVALLSALGGGTIVSKKNCYWRATKRKKRKKEKNTVMLLSLFAFCSVLLTFVLLLVGIGCSDIDDDYSDCSSCDSFQ